MHAFSRATLITVLMLWMPVGALQAGPLPLDPNALPAYRGDTGTLTSTLGAFSISMDLQYAVYAPGKFNLSFGPGADPSGGTQYVYAYQFYNAGSAGAFVFSGVSVNLLLGNQAANIEALPLSFGNYGQLPVSASFASSPPTSARWSYTTANLPVGGQTQILLFTSPHGPTRSTAQATGGLGVTTDGSHLVPTPIPEPHASVIIVSGVMVLGGAAVRRAITRRREAKSLLL
jgi:hypothetical protein